MLKFVLRLLLVKDDSCDRLLKLSTPRDSQAVPQPSTNLALSCLASEFGWDLALSAQYGRQLIRRYCTKPYCSQIIQTGCIDSELQQWQQ